LKLIQIARKQQPNQTSFMEKSFNRNAIKQLQKIDQLHDLFDMKL